MSGLCCFIEPVNGLVEVGLGRGAAEQAAGKLECGFDVAGISGFLQEIGGLGQVGMLGVEHV
ncbi:hypothetical protein l11_06350 [Neisseria weaveri LMG 5135]|nr:hypothetical protein l11_06350 [Neisseria weaveri LMG 5135]